MNQGSSTPAATWPDPGHWVDEHGDYLYRYALARVRCPEVAEDLVQETFLAALRAIGTFAGRSTERTWLTAILKNKLVDWLRHRHGPQIVHDSGQADDWINRLYDRRGHWRPAPGKWGSDPVELLERQEFWEAFARCCGKLPQSMWAVLSLRLLDDVPAAEICQALGISATNLWTLLHRARVRLWHCLDRQGFAPGPFKDKS
jgi:RNA polymerase sigma-70 factor (ECF subfamily)